MRHAACGLPSRLFEGWGRGHGGGGAWHHERAAAVAQAAEATLRLWGDDGADFDALAADIAVEARLALTVSDEIKTLDKRIAGLYPQVDPTGIVRSAPGVDVVGAPQIAGRLGDASRFANLVTVRSFAGLVPHHDASGQAARAGGPTKAGDGCLREALFISADHARKIGPTIAARYHRLIIDGGKHHNAAIRTIATVLLTRIAACLRNGTPTTCATPTAARSPSRKAAPSSPSATRSPKKLVPPDGK